MTAPAFIKQSDLKRMATIAKAQGVKVEIEVDGRIIRVVPETTAKLKSKSAKDEPISL